jgi:hypothetical protein
VTEVTHSRALDRFSPSIAEFDGNLNSHPNGRPLDLPHHICSLSPGRRQLVELQFLHQVEQRDAAPLLAETVEDKIIQQAVATVLEANYEEDLRTMIGGGRAPS